MTGTVAVGFLDPGSWSAVFGHSLTRLYLADIAGSQRMVPNGMELRSFCPANGLVASRNATAARFLDDTDCEWLFTVDTDMGFGSDTVDRLVAAAEETQVPVMGGLCFSLRKSGESGFGAPVYVTVPTCFRFVETESEAGFQPILDYPRDTVFPVAATGAACMLLHRSALEAVRAKYGDRWYDPVVHPKGSTFSEDLSLCVRLAGCDLPVHVDTSVKTCHDKGGVFLDEEQYDRQPDLAAQLQSDSAA